MKERPCVTPATVTSDSPLEVLTDGASTAVPASRLTSYTPTEDDRVAVVRFGTSLLVLGEVSS